VYVLLAPEPQSKGDDMEHLTTTPDVRDLDCLFLATIGGVDYYETRQIVKQDNGVRSVVGLASNWPLISRDARITELTQLLTASEQRSVEADCHVAELLARLSNYEEQIEPPIVGQIHADADSESAFIAPVSAVAARDDGKIPCDFPGCLDWVKPRGLPAHKRQAHGVVGTTGHHPSMAADQSPETDARRKCPYCRLRPLIIGMDAHIARAHPKQPPIEPPIALALGDAPWRCSACHTDAHARSLKDPARCIRCVVASADAAHTNGHLAAA
jgi:DNA-directed RNA polymerase subunit RPC12/RpoP